MSNMVWRRGRDGGGGGRDGGRIPNFLLQAFVVLVCLCSGLQGLITDETLAEDFMKELDARYSYECNREMTARWDYITDVTDTDKEQIANDAAVRYLGFKGEAAVNCSQFDYTGFSDVSLYRRFRFLSKQGPGALEEADLTEYKTLQSQMETTYSTATICDFYSPSECGLELEPDLESILATSENWEELRYVWEEWREKSGKLMREDYLRFVELSNQAAVLDGFSDTGDYWLNPYTVDQREADYYTGGMITTQEGFRNALETVWTEVSDGLYKKLHSYVRMRLSEVYPGKVDLTGPIPAHILGNMWAQDWTNIARFVMPFPDYPSYDVTDSMLANGWDIGTMFDASEDFFTSVGLFNMTPTFWRYSVTNQTAWGKTMVCHASAEDFCLGSDGDDYRIKMCTEVNMGDLVTVHHEMGHIEYFMTYRDLPHVFRDSANPGFHEAIGDLIALSVSTPQHLEDVLGLTPSRSDPGKSDPGKSDPGKSDPGKSDPAAGKSDQKSDPAPGKSDPGKSDPAAGKSDPGKSDQKYTEQEMRDLNFLMKMALEKIAFLPFGYLIDKYRWGVFEGTTTSADLNSDWWDLRVSLQGVKPPEGTRGEEFFDAGAKYHVPANVPYIRYFVSFIVQFQFQQTLCQASGHTGPLHTCDLYNNKVAGGILRSAMEKGFSQPWPKVLSELGGSAEMDSRAIVDYFRPLVDYLDEALVEAGQCVGWGDDCTLQQQQQQQQQQQEAIESNAELIDYSDDIESDYHDDYSDDDDRKIDYYDDDSKIDYYGNDGAPTTEPDPYTTSDDPDGLLSSSTTESAREEEARVEMERMNARIIALVRDASFLDWIYNTDITQENADNANEAWGQVSAAYNEEYERVILEYKDEYEGFKDESLKRQFRLQANRGTAALSPADFDKLTSAVSRMTSVFGEGLVCPAQDKDCNEDKDGYDIDTLEGEMAKVTVDLYDDLLYYWEAWRDVSGKKMVDDYKTYIDLQNLAAVENGFENAADMWVDAYVETGFNQTSFRSEIEALWSEVRPLYLKLHAYVRHRLLEEFGDKMDNSTGLIPAHLLGNMWGQSWENIYELVKPFPNANITDITPDLQENIVDVRQMFQIAENFFTSIDLYPMTQDFRVNSLYEVPADGHPVICHASAWDFMTVVNDRMDGEFRIKMCTDKNQEDFIVIHHEMGHTQYQMAYSVPKELRPMVFRDGANPGFHEAIGDTIALSVSTPEHLRKISEWLQSGAFREDPKGISILKKEREEEEEDLMRNYEEDINFLMKTALAKVAFVPFAYILDQWRWEIFADEDKKDNYNEQWWQKRLDVQGIYPPVDRFPKSDFDPGSKYHVPAGVPYIRYFVSHILQYQFHQRLCSFDSDWQEIYNCDIYGNKEAGHALRSMLVKGASEPWRQQLSEFLADDGMGMNASAMLDYFGPLDDYLTDYLTTFGIETNWTSPKADEFMKSEPTEIPATVPIVVGSILAVMVLGVLVAYFIGRDRQKKKRKAELTTGGGDGVVQDAAGATTTSAATSTGEAKVDSEGHESIELQ